jgi:ribosome-binding factor A
MSQGARPDRVADQIRSEIAWLLARGDVHDPGIGFVTVTRVQVSSDIQQARVYYTALGDASARKTTAQALERAGPFLRRQIGSRLRLKRVPELKFYYDESIAGQDRIEQLLNQIHAEPGTSEDGARGSSGRESANDSEHRQRRSRSASADAVSRRVGDPDCRARR